MILTGNGSPSRDLEEATRASPYHVAEHHSTRPETKSLQPYTERSSRSGSEPPSVEADVYVWRYALLWKKKKKLNKWLSYRRGTARRLKSVEILSTAAQLYEKLTFD